MAEGGDLEYREYECEWYRGGRGTEVCEELRKRRMDVCCLQEVRWRGQGAWFLSVKGRRYKLWWSGNSDGRRCESFGGEGAMRKGCGGAKEE